MKETKEINALLHLIDDPDEEVFSTVRERIETFGKAIIPNLENLWEHTINAAVQERIELLIHRLHFRDLKDSFLAWKEKENNDLLEGALLVSKYQYPELNISLLYHEIEKMRRNIWLELNNFLTPLEEANVFYNILFNYYKLGGKEINYSEPDTFLTHKVIETKKGNSISNGIIYLVLCELLDIPVKAIQIPRQFLLAYFDKQEAFTHQSVDRIIFFIDPLNGRIYNRQDIEGYFMRINKTASPSYFHPMSNKKIIQLLLAEYKKCFNELTTSYKNDELTMLVEILDD